MFVRYASGGRSYRIISSCTEFLVQYLSFAYERRDACPVCLSLSESPQSTSGMLVARRSKEEGRVRIYQGPRTGERIKISKFEKNERIADGPLSKAKVVAK